MRSYTLSKRDTSDLLNSLQQTWPASLALPKLKGIRIVEIDKKRNLFLAEAFAVVRLEGAVLPFLQSVDLLTRFPAVEVDAGAVPFVVKGADIMRPGVTAFSGDFQPGAVVVVRDQRYQKYLAAGHALLARAEAEAMRKGAVVKNLHHMGDKFWEVYKDVAA